jgi:asparagine synthase (glutamine-hydrolysing)
MCGIAGIYNYRDHAGPVDREELRAIRDHMAARGPDGRGEWYSADNRVGLGHRRLSIIDLSERAAQPMASADGALAISFNGEIYNYRALKKDLEAKGHVFRSDSDTEVLLHLYAEKGEAMVHELRGMFAFALWDGNKKAMLLVRDPFGIKPLYYADDGDTLRAASQVKALFHAPIDKSPEPAGHAGFFLWGSVPAPWTLYRGIRNLPGGHYVWVNERGVGQPRPYCLLSDILAEACAAPATCSRPEALAIISDALKDSMAAHLVSDVPVSVFLSAGLDSAMIAALVAENGTKPHSLTLGFNEFSGTINDEVPLSEALSLRLGTRHTTVMIGRKDFETDREKLLAAMDQPSIDGVNTWFVARAASSQGIKVALSGLGGDELFASYPSFDELPRIMRLVRPFSCLPGLGKGIRKISAPLVSRFTSPKYAGLLEYGGSLGGAYLLRRGLYMPWELPNVLDPELARQGWHELEAHTGLENYTAGVSNDRLAVSALEMSRYMRHQLLSDTDWASMAHSLEIRVPFLDIPLLREIAPLFSAHPEITKAEIAAVVFPNCSPSLLRRPKTGFSVPVREWFKPQGIEIRERGLRHWAKFIYESFNK